MNLSCSSKMIKYLMFGFNLIFVISGIIVIAVGAAVKTVYTEYSDFLDNKYFSLPNMLIATGAFIFIVSFFGCCGAIKESWSMLAIFSVFLCIIFIFEFACGIAGYALRDRTADFLESTLRDNLDSYNTTHTIWDLIQGSFHCCGVDSYIDWEGKFPPDNHSLPISCCPVLSGTTGAFFCNSFETPLPTPSTTTTTISTPTTNATSSTTNAPNSTTIAPPPTDNTTVTNVTSAPTETPNPPANGTNENSPNLRRKRGLNDDSLYGNDTVPTPPPTTSRPYMVGCKLAFGDYVKKHAVQIGGWGLGLAIIQILGIVFSCHLVRQLKYSYSST